MFASVAELVGLGEQIFDRVQAVEELSSDAVHERLGKFDPLPQVVVGWNQLNVTLRVVEVRPFYEEVDEVLPLADCRMLGVPIIG